MLKIKKISYNSPVILTFTFVSLAALILNTLTGGATNALLFSVYRAPLTDLLFYPRLFLHVLGHSGLSHFVGNFTIILLIGPMLEEKYGWKLLLILIAVTAFITGLVNVLFFSTGLLGASGVAFMLIILSSFANSDQDTIPLTFILVALVYIGGEILNGLFTRDDIAQFAHIIGGVCGGAAGLVYSGTNIGKKRR